MSVSRIPAVEELERKDRHYWRRGDNKKNTEISTKKERKEEKFKRMAEN